MHPGLSCLLLLPTLLPATNHADPPDLPYNIVMIVLDDAGTDQLTFYANPPSICPSAPPPPSSCTTPCDYARTPNLAALAASGVRFTNFRATPFCSPSRACMLTGRYPFRTGIGTVISGVNNYAVSDDEVFVSEVLKWARPSLGYACGAFGKWHLMPATDDPTDSIEPENCNDNDCELSANESHAIRNGYDVFSGSMGNQRGSFCWTRVKATVVAEPCPYVSSPSSTLCCHDFLHPQTPPPPPSSNFGPTVNRTDALAWIGQQSGPFFAYVAFNPPHTPLQVPPSSLLSYDTRCELETAFDLRFPALRGTSVSIPQNPQDPNFAVQLQKAKLVYHAMLEAVDSEIGQIVLALANGIGPATLENTMLLVVGDNGTLGKLINAPFADTQGKGTVFEGGIRVPMIVSGPLVLAPGSECAALVDAVDMWRTIPRIAGLTNAEIDTYFATEFPSQTSDSKSFLTLIETPSGAGERTEFSFSQQFNWNSIPPVCVNLHERAMVKLNPADGNYYKYTRRLRLPVTGCYGGPGVPVGSCLIPPATSCAAPAYVHALYDLSVTPLETVNLVPLIVPGTPLESFYVGMQASMTALSGE